MTFEEFDLYGNLLDGLHSMNYDSATPIQEAAIPVILDKKDIIACAQTGTGKTAAYLVPLMQRIMDMPQGQTRALIIAPTRELAHQIDQNYPCHRLSRQCLLGGCLWWQRQGRLGCTEKSH